MLTGSASPNTDLWDESAGLRGRADIDAMVPIRTAEELDAQAAFEVARSWPGGWATGCTQSSPRPFWSTYALLGFSGMMVDAPRKPELFNT